MINQAIPFLEKITKKINETGININSLEIDHLCYRTSSEQNYLEVKSYFQQQGELLIESEVNGRLIATYKLKKPIHFKEWIIDLIEVPAPKANKRTLEGFEHIEIVIEESFSMFMNQYSDLEFVTKGMDKNLNPEIEIEFMDCAVKFHHKSLEQVIHIEKNLKVLNFLKEINPFRIFKNFSPCISGTLPLDIHNQSSDLDILFSCSDLILFEEKLKEHENLFDKLEIKRALYQDHETIVATFVFHDLPVEFFCQTKLSYQQQANQHMLTEGRLLKILGSTFKEEIKRLKLEGIKTELAFGKVLKIEDPYNELLRMKNLTDRELHNRYKHYFNKS